MSQPNSPSSSSPSAAPAAAVSPMPQPSRPDPPMEPLSKRVIAWVAAGIAVATAGLVVVLWWAGTRGLSGEALVTARFDALRTGLSIGLGGGGIFALYLAWRRQHSTEIGLQQKAQDQADVARAYELQRETFETTRLHQVRVATATERDAEARRITDLYTKAADQLGSDKAPVRLAGLYALERLAQDTPSQRQTIVNVLCAYLRMPYTLPGDPPGVEADDKLVDAHRDRAQEREVRLAAQGILFHHLRPGDDPAHPVETFWADIDLDLTGAILIDFVLADCTLRGAVFVRATFTGAAPVFTSATFSSAVFTSATFTGAAWFYGATFSNAVFTSATFTGDAWFDGATFSGNAWFDGATFTGTARFYGATFTGTAVFGRTIFGGDTWFGGATFTGDAVFDGATFTGDAVFDGAAFTGIPWSGGALPSTTHWVDRTPPVPGTSFERTRFARGVPAEVARFVEAPPDETTPPADN